MKSNNFAGAANWGQVYLRHSQELIMMYARVHPDSVEFLRHATNSTQPRSTHQMDVSKNLSRSGRFIPGESDAACVYNIIQTVLGDMHINNKVSFYMQAG